MCCNDVNAFPSLKKTFAEHFYDALLIYCVYARVSLLAVFFLIFLPGFVVINELFSKE